MYTYDGEKPTMFCLCLIPVVLILGGNRKRDRKRKREELFKWAKSVIKILYA